MSRQSLPVVSVDSNSEHTRDARAIARTIAAVAAEPRRNRDLEAQLESSLIRVMVSFASAEAIKALVEAQEGVIGGDE